MSYRDWYKNKGLDGRDDLVYLLYLNEKAKSGKFATKTKFNFKDEDFILEDLEATL